MDKDDGARWFLNEIFSANIGLEVFIIHIDF